MSNPILQTDTQDIIAGLLGAFAGFLGSLIIEWYKKRRHPKEINSDALEKINEAAQKNVESARTVIELLEDRLAEERSYNDSQIYKSRRECEDKIVVLQDRYKEEIEKLRKEVNETKEENVSLKSKITELTKDNEKLVIQVFDLTERLKKYEIANPQ